MFISMDDKKEFVISSKFKAQFEKLRTEAIRKDIEENKDKYTDIELKVLNKLLEESISNYEKNNESYMKGSLIFGAEDLLETQRKISDMLGV